VYIKYCVQVIESLLKLHSTALNDNSLVDTLSVSPLYVTHQSSYVSMFRPH